MIATGIAAADQFNRAKLGLSDQAYYDKFVAPYGKERYRQAVGEGGAMERGAKLRQGQIVSSQFGGQPTSLGEAATSSMAPSFRKAMRGAVERAQADVDRFGAAKMMERKQDIAEAMAKIGTTSKIEAGSLGMAGSALGAIGAGLSSTGLGAAAGLPLMIAGGLAGLGSAGIGAAGAGIQAGMSADIANLNKRPLRTLQFGDPSYGERGPTMSQGGGGLYDLYNLTYG